MSFTGASTLQATQITSVINRTTALESRASTIEQTAQTQRSDFGKHVADQNTRDINQEGRLTTLESASSLTNSTHNAYVVLNNAKNGDQDSHISKLESDVAANLLTFQQTVNTLNTTDGLINTHLTLIDSNITTTNTTATTFRKTYDSYIAANDILNTAQDTRLTTVENDVSAFHTAYEVDKTNVAKDLSDFHGAYDSYTQANDALNTTQDGRLTLVETKAETSKQNFEAYIASNTSGNTTTSNVIAANKSEYDAYVELNDAKNQEQDDRLDGVETRLEAIDTNIIGRVDDAINSKVATTTFELLANELRNADSALSITLATKVATTVQVATDLAQDAKIDARVLTTDYNAYTTSDINTNKLNEIKIAAMEQFIRTLLATYTIKNGSDQTYVYKGYAQKDFEIAPAAISFVSRFNDAAKINLKVLEFVTRSNSNQLRIYSSSQVVLLSTSLATESKTVSTSLGDITNVYTMTRAVLSSDFPIKLRYQDTNGNAICEQVLTYEQYQALPNSDAPVVVASNDTITRFANVVSLTFTPTVSGGMFYPQLSSDGGATWGSYLGDYGAPYTLTAGTSITLNVNLTSMTTANKVRFSNSSNVVAVIMNVPVAPDTINTFTILSASSSSGTRTITYNASYIGTAAIGVWGTNDATAVPGASANGWNYLGAVASITKSGSNLSYTLSNDIGMYTYYRFFEQAAGEAALSQKFSFTA